MYLQRDPGAEVVGFHIQGRLIYGLDVAELLECPLCPCISPIKGL